MRPLAQCSKSEPVGVVETPAYLDPATGATYPLGEPRWRSAAGGPLLITPGPGIGAADIDTTERSLWRYRAALPLEIEDPITLGEGCTPLVRREWAGARPFFKLEWFSPSGSFKDRGASVMLSALRQQGVTSVIEDSSGNGGAAIAAYGAAGGLEVAVFAPASTSPAKLVQARAYGARIELVEGPREASQAAAIAAAEQGDGFYASHNWQAFFLEGTKTLAYEIWEDLGFRAPDCVVMPVGAGSSLLGCAFGFRELLLAGQIERLPRLYAAQPLNCSPVDAVFRAGQRGSIGPGDRAGAGAEAGAGSGAEAGAGPGSGSDASSGSGPDASSGSGADRAVLPTIAEGTAIRNPLRLAEMLSELRETRGGTVAVPEDEIIAAHRGLAERGLFAEPTSATAAAAHARLVASGAIRAEEIAVVILTGSGLKAAHALQTAHTL